MQWLFWNQVGYAIALARWEWWICRDYDYNPDGVDGYFDTLNLKLPLTWDRLTG
jgi:hypothetical protein